jgi:hypothetical protein
MVGTTLRPAYTYKIMDPKKFVRKPPTTENYYNVIIDNSDNWKDYPKRSRSIMTHTLESKTKMYGNKVYRVIPLRENAKCAFVENDYWVAFQDLFDAWPFGRIESLNDFNKNLAGAFNLKSKNYTSDKLKQLLRSSNFNNKNLSIYKPDSVSEYKERILEIEKKYGSFYDWIDMQMAPEKAEAIGLFNYNNIYHIEGTYNTEYLSLQDHNRSPFTALHGYEVWTDEKCLLVDDTILTQLWIKKKNS